MDVQIKYETLQAPVITRWWTVGECAKRLSSFCMVYHTMMENMLYMPYKHVNGAYRKIIKVNLSLMNNNEIKIDVFLIKGIHQEWLDVYMLKMKRGDSLLTDQSCYLACLMLSSYFLMHDSLTNMLEGNWVSAEGFQYFLEYNNTHLNKYQKEIQGKSLL